jgi:hypothetical protein
MRSNTSAQSCPRLSRASTSFLRAFSEKDVDGRDKPGHDCGEVIRHYRTRPTLIVRGNAYTYVRNRNSTIRFDDVSLATGEHWLRA